MGKTLKYNSLPMCNLTQLVSPLQKCKRKGVGVDVVGFHWPYGTVTCVYRCRQCACEMTVRVVLTYFLTFWGMSVRCAAFLQSQVNMGDDVAIHVSGAVFGRRFAGHFGCNSSVTNWFSAHVNYMANQNIAATSHFSKKTIIPLLGERGDRYNWLFSPFWVKSLLIFSQ